MIDQELASIVQQEQVKGTHQPYIRSLLKEYLQIRILFFIYTTKEYDQNLIFTGGTCLRHFYNIERLSEDVDFDYLDNINVNQLQQDLEDYFVKKEKYNQIQISVHQRGDQILLKFPVLYQLGLANFSQSDLLYIKLDLSANLSPHYSVITSSASKCGFNFVAKHYDLPDLMAGKIHAILSREYLRGKDNRLSVKGRDYYDLLWFVKQAIKPNLARLSDLLGRRVSSADISQELDRKVDLITTKLKTDFKNDLLPFLLNPEAVPGFVDNYQDEYNRHKKKSFF